MAIFQHLNWALSFLAFDRVSKHPFPSLEMSLAVYKSERAYTSAETYITSRSARESQKECYFLISCWERIDISERLELPNCRTPFIMPVSNTGSAPPPSRHPKWVSLIWSVFYSAPRSISSKVRSAKHIGLARSFQQKTEKRSANKTTRVSV